MLNKILGALAIIAGIFLIFIFPDIREYQFEPMSVGGIIVGIALFGAGVYLILS